ncbi:hypothetical protein TNCV_115441 [Trichonephila clavipes]|nr:hypothetical protein TNCV_115441 [Trichonephila clavipes]
MSFYICATEDPQCREVAARLICLKVLPLAWVSTEVSPWSLDHSPVLRASAVPTDWSTDSMAGKAVSLHSLLANRNGKIYRQNFEVDDFPSGAVDLYKGWRANSRGFYSLLRLPENTPAGKRTR